MQIISAHMQIVPACSIVDSNMAIVRWKLASHEETVGRFSQFVQVSISLDAAFAEN